MPTVSSSLMISFFVCLLSMSLRGGSGRRCSDIALVLAVDGSDSIDDDEYAF